ncbi:MAG: cell division protein FtsA [Bacteroidales bacterium]|nr:cell division protein FtsA [Bacteroidales bacterium]
MNRYIAAIDLGTTKIVTIVAEVSSNGVKVIGYNQAPYQGGIMRGNVVNIQKCLETLLPTLDCVNEQINTMPDSDPRQISEVYVGISGHHLNCIENTLHRNRNISTSRQLINQEEVQTMIDEMFNTPVDAKEQVLEVIPQSFNVDEQIGCSNIIGMDGDSIEAKFKLFVGKVSSVNHIKLVLNRANLTLKKMYLSSIASAEAVLTDDEKELGVMMIDIGAGTSDVVVYYDNIIRHIAVIPFAGNAITQDIRLTCEVSFKNAELLKRQHGSCLSEQAQENKHIAIRDKYGNITQEIPYKYLAETIEARVCEIIATALHELELSGFKDKVKKIVLTGGSSSLNHIQTLTKELSGLNVRLSTPINPNILSTSISEIYKPGASTAVGLILLGKNEPVTEKVEERDQDKDLWGNNIVTPPPAPKKKKKFKNIFSEIFNQQNDNEA